MSLAEAFGRKAREGRLNLEGRSLAYVEAGAVAPPVVFVAGGGDTALAWAAVALNLGDRRMIAYDRAGLGASDAGSSDQQAMVADLASLIERLGAAPAVVVAHSLGALIAEQLTWARRDLVAALVLVDPAREELFTSGGAVRAQLAASSLSVGLARIRVLPTLNRRVGARRAAALPPERRPPFVEAAMATGSTRHALAAREEFRGIKDAAPSLTRTRASVPPLTVPIVVLSATRAPAKLRARWTSLQASAAVSTGFAEHRLVEGSGHEIHIERPEIVAQAVQDVLAAVTDWRPTLADRPPARWTGADHPSVHEGPPS